MADLTGKTVKSTYKDLLKIDSDAGGTTNSGLEDGVMKDVTDGEGQSSALSMSTTQVKITDLEATTADINGGTIDGATIVTPDLTATTADINGGTIDGSNINSTPIGDTAQSTASVSSLDIGGTPTTSAHANIQRDKNKTTIAKEGVIFEKSGTLSAVMVWDKSQWADFLVIEAESNTAGGSFVVEVEGILTSGVDTKVPGFNTVTGDSGSTACELIWNGTDNIKLKMLLDGSNASLEGISEWTMEYLMESVDGVDPHVYSYSRALCCILSGFSITNYSTFNDEWGGEPPSNHWQDVDQEDTYLQAILHTNPADNSFELPDSSDTPRYDGVAYSDSTMVEKFITASVPTGTYTGNIVFAVRDNAEVQPEDFSATGEIFSYGKCKMIGMARNTSWLEHPDAADETATSVWPDVPWRRRKTVYPEYSFSQSGWTNYSGPTPADNATRMGLTGFYNPMLHNSYYAMGSAGEGTDGTDVLLKAGETQASTVHTWDTYYAAAGTGKVPYTDGSNGIKWPRWNDILSWAKFNDTFDYTGDSLNDHGHREKAFDSHVLPIWGYSKEARDNSGQETYSEIKTVADRGIPTAAMIDDHFSNPTLEETRELAFQMRCRSTNTGTGDKLWYVSFASTSGYGGSTVSVKRVLGISYHVRVISSWGDGKPYVKSIRQTDWEGVNAMVDEE